MAHHLRQHGALLDDGAEWRDVSVQNREPALLMDRIVQRSDDIVVVNAGRGDVFSDRGPRHRHRSARDRLMVSGPRPNCCSQPLTVERLPS